MKDYPFFILMVALFAILSYYVISGLFSKNKDIVRLALVASPMYILVGWLVYKFCWPMVSGFCTTH